MADFYNDLEELKECHTENEDYAEELRDLNKGITVLAIHGGYIEPFTAFVAKNIAKDDYNLYLFHGLNKRNANKLHITSHRFKQNDLEEVLLKSDAAISVHGCGDKKNKITYIGGLNDELKSLVKKNLEEKGFFINEEKWPAIFRNNVVNRTKNQGAQLELTLGLRYSFFDENMNLTQDFLDYIQAIRTALEDYKKLDSQI